MSFGAAIQFGDDGFGAGAESIQHSKRPLQFALENHQVGAQAGAAGVHEVSEELAGDGAEHRFLADVRLHLFAQGGEDLLHLERFRRLEHAENASNFGFEVFNLGLVREELLQVLLGAR